MASSRKVPVFDNILLSWSNGLKATDPIFSMTPVIWSEPGTCTSLRAMITWPLGRNGNQPSFTPGNCERFSRSEIPFSHLSRLPGSRPCGLLEPAAAGSKRSLGCGQLHFLWLGASRGFFFPSGPRPWWITVAPAVLNGFRAADDRFSLSQLQRASHSWRLSNTPASSLKM
jgi:hypothetical protein